MKVVIPGGSGQVGTLLARAFVQRGHEVVELRRRPRAAPWRSVAVGEPRRSSRAGNGNATWPVGPAAMATSPPIGHDREPVDVPRSVSVLKEDALGRVELLDFGGERRVRRFACGGWIPLSGLVAGVLLARERRVLRALDGLVGVPRLCDAEPAPRRQLTRSYLAGVPLWLATELPTDYFDQLERLVRALHGRGVCHNDLHKESNILVGPDGRPAVIDFQLASIHRRRRGAKFRSRVRDDLRHVAKHRARYERAMGPFRTAIHDPVPRGVVANAWRRFVKPLYNAVTRRLLKHPDGEPRRPRTGPWPVWTARVGEDS